MTRGLLILALIGCSDDAKGRHDVVDCKANVWAPTGQQQKRCELGCAAGPSGGVDPDGDLVDQTCWLDLGGGLQGCAARLVASYEGERGCCVPSGVDPVNTLAYVECGDAP